MEIITKSAHGHIIKLMKKSKTAHAIFIKPIKKQKAHRYASALKKDKPVKSTVVTAFFKDGQI